MEAPDPAEPVAPLDAEEDSVWRALARAMIVIPRVLGVALEAEHHLTLAEYFVLMNLSEEPGGALRMSELASRGSLSVSGMTRVVDRLTRNGLVERVRCPSDARGFLAVLTPLGISRLQQAYPTHLRTVRENVVDHLSGMDLPALAERLAHMAEREPGPRLASPVTPTPA